MALVLMRAAEESIMIGDNIEIIVMGFKRSKSGDCVKLLFKAPREVAIYRKEIWLEKQEEKRRADADKPAMKKPHA